MQCNPGLRDEEYERIAIALNIAILGVRELVSGTLALAILVVANRLNG